jgi:hypothetical protein
VSRPSSRGEAVRSRSRRRVVDPGRLGRNARHQGRCARHCLRASESPPFVLRLQRFQQTTSSSCYAELCITAIMRSSALCGGTGGSPQSSKPGNARISA